MAKLPKPYLSKSMNNIVVLSLGLIAVFFLYRYIKSLENDVVKLRSDMDKIEDSANALATCSKPTGGDSVLKVDPVASTYKYVPTSTEFEKTPSHEEDDTESIQSDELTAMLRAVLVNDGMACVEQEEEDDTVEVYEADADADAYNDAEEDEMQADTESGDNNDGEEAIEHTDSSSSGELSTEEVRNLLSGKTCEQLRSLLKERGVENLKGKKSDLVERILSC